MTSKKKGKKNTSKNKKKGKGGKKRDAKKKLEKKLAKKKLEKKRRKKSKKDRSSTNAVDTMQRAATLDVSNPAMAATTNEVMPSMQTTQSIDDGNLSANTAVFEWDGTGWTCAEDNCDYGCVPQTPSEPGTFVGQRTVTTCQASVEGMSCPPAE